MQKTPPLTPETAADQVLSNYWTGVVPLDLLALAQGLQVSVQSVPMTAPTVAHYQRAAEGPALIQVSRDEVSVRRRYAVAVALGHHVMGYETTTFSVESFSLGSGSVTTARANSFALALLMPRDAITVLLRSGYRTPDRLAAALGVSTVALVERLKRLGIL